MDSVKQCYNETQSQYPTERLPKRPRTPHMLLDDCKYIYEVKQSLNMTLVRAGGKVIKENLPSGDIDSHREMGMIGGPTDISPDWINTINLQ